MSGGALKIGAICSREQTTWLRALQAYDNASAIDPKNSEAYEGQAKILYGWEQYMDAKKAFDESNAIAPTRKKVAFSLHCLAFEKKFDLLKKEIAELARKETSPNLRVATLSEYVFDQLGEESPYPFCKNPLDFIEYGNCGLSEMILKTSSRSCSKRHPGIPSSGNEKALRRFPVGFPK